MQACAQGNTVLRKVFVLDAVERPLAPNQLQYSVLAMPTFT